MILEDINKSRKKEIFGMTSPDPVVSDNVSLNNLIFAA